MCRVWVPGKPPGHQARARSCEGIERAAPAGSWIVYRPGRDRKVVHVREVDRRRAGVIVRLRVYDAHRGTLIREG
jgi:DNA invertase Pin-like site-specific DNA recombinase